MQLITDIQNYTPQGAEETANKASFLQLLETYGETAFARECLVGHICTSAWIVNQDNTRVLMAYHNMFQSFGWLGGHADGNQDLRQVITEEIQQESGLKDFQILDGFMNLSVNTVYYHVKRGTPTPTHLHFDVCWLVQANDSQPIRIKEDENSAIAWLDRETFMEKISEEHMSDFYPTLQVKADKILAERGL